MPFTFLAHQAPVIPLKLRWPSRFDGVALAVGTMAPDFAYPLDRTPLAVEAHALPGLFTFGLPVTLAVAFVVRRVAAPRLPRLLPPGPPLHLEDYEILGRHRHRWWVVAGSSVTGLLSHVFVDAFTHRRGIFVRLIPALRRVWLEVDGRKVPGFEVLQYGGHVWLSVAAAGMLLWIGRRRWLLDETARRRTAWQPSEVGAAARVRFAVGSAFGAAVAAVLVVRAPLGFSASIVAAAAAMAAGLLAGAVAALPRRPA
ncbi:MAG: DUF4184 family protein [Actinobacteria bacterium]|nr:DUF4184 family protein [Actinomycetota bacterium]